MFDQKGQAFSVFELMIAAIVAIAILFVLLPIITNITTPTGDAKASIGNVISAIGVGGTQRTTTFQIGANETIRTSYFSDKGVDEEAVCFERGKFTDAQIEIGDDCRSFTNMTNRAINAKALVVCEYDAETLEDTLDMIDVDTDESPTSLWDSGQDYAGYNKVCFVILEKA
ncbi:MAG: hypothetical protein PHP82_04070 [Candidatus ainarchaeum sp.]|nr:hypothetical protein [Candidatus ainarchaeum sp.]